MRFPHGPVPSLGNLGYHERAVFAHERFVKSSVFGRGLDLIKRAGCPGFRLEFIDSHGVIVPLPVCVVVDTAAGHHRGRVHSVHPAEQIDLVRAQIHQRPAAVFFKQAPVPEFGHRVVAILLQLALVYGVPFGPAQHIALGPVPLGIHRVHSSQQIFLMDQTVDGMDIPRIAPALVADLQKLAGFSRCLDHGPGFSERVGHLLFAVDMEAGLHAGIGVLRVHPVRGGHDHCVQALLFAQHVPVILINVNFMSVFLQIPAGIPLAVFPDIADRGKPDPGYAQTRLDQHTALCARTDERHFEFGWLFIFLHSS